MLLLLVLVLSLLVHEEKPRVQCKLLENNSSNNNNSNNGEQLGSQAAKQPSSQPAKQLSSQASGKQKRVGHRKTKTRKVKSRKMRYTTASAATAPDCAYELNLSF